MFSPKAKLRTAAVVATAAAALTGLGAGTASASDWPPLKWGGYLYTGFHNSGTETVLDLTDFGTCHNLSEPANSEIIVSETASLTTYSGTDCTGYGFRSGGLSQTDYLLPALSYRVTPVTG
ncbi:MULTISPECIES: hypothetical protein [unclassified Streptomyces]|uniref:hypothetical protein n=1 Tax=unclassified Streptomyces TaxID=2593676 RepID=UPI0004C5AC3E|nr:MULTISPECIES: hypothetical protein [unclassified Streptomyces]KOV92008.1 hypothetical protein ADL02_12125 [Streptomyces sp. NRRL WC-3723]